MTASSRLSVSTVDCHAAGEPFRIVTAGVPPLPGDSVLAKRRYAMAELDEIRQLVINEPRGHADMYGCFVTEPDDDGADLGVVFFHNAGYSTACGHGTIALVTWALEHGIVAATEADVPVVVDVPSGRLEATAQVEGDRAGTVRFRNVPAFVVEENLRLETAAGSVEVDVAFGGAFYASIDARRLGLPVEPKNIPTFIDLGREVKGLLESAHDVVHPLEPELRDIYGVIFFQDEGDGPTLTQRNVTVFANGEVDRSPCGSGTSARLALLERSKHVSRGTSLRHRSIVGTEFNAYVVGEANVDGIPAVITEVEGAAYLTGRHEFVLRPDDPLGTGFQLR